MRRRPERRSLLYTQKASPQRASLRTTASEFLEGVGSRGRPTFNPAEGDNTTSEPPTNPWESDGEGSKTVWVLLGSKAWTVWHWKTRDGTSSSLRLSATMFRLKVWEDQTRTEKPVTETGAEHSRTAGSPHVLPSMAHRAPSTRVLTRPVCFGARSRRRLRDARKCPTMPLVFGYEKWYSRTQ